MASSRSSSHGRSPSFGPTSLPARRRIRRTQGARRRAELDVVSWSTLLLLRTSLEKFPFGHETSGALRAFYTAFTTGSELLLAQLATVEAMVLSARRSSACTESSRCSSFVSSSFVCERPRRL